MNMFSRVLPLALGRGTEEKKHNGSGGVHQTVSESGVGVGLVVGERGGGVVMAAASDSTSDSAPPQAHSHSHSHWHHGRLPLSLTDAAQDNRRAKWPRLMQHSDTYAGTGADVDVSAAICIGLSHQTHAVTHTTNTTNIHTHIHTCALEWAHTASPLHQCAADILPLICHHLDSCEIVNLARTCKYLYKQLQSAVCWKYTDYSSTWVFSSICYLNRHDHHNEQSFFQAAFSPLGCHMRSMTVYGKITAEMMGALKRFAHLQSLSFQHYNGKDYSVRSDGWTDLFQFLSPTLIRLHYDAYHDTHSYPSAVWDALPALTGLQELALPPLSQSARTKVAVQLLRMPQLRVLGGKHHFKMEDLLQIASNCSQPLQYRRKIHIVHFSQSQSAIPNIAHLYVCLGFHSMKEHSFLQLAAFRQLTSLNIDVEIDFREPFPLTTHVTLPSLTQLRVYYSNWCEQSLQWLREWNSPRYLPSLQTLNICGYRCCEYHVGPFNYLTLSSSPSPSLAPPPIFTHLNIAPSPSKGGNQALSVYMGALLRFFPHISQLTLSGRSGVWQQSADSFSLDELTQLSSLKELRVRSRKPSDWHGYLSDGVERVRQLFAASDRQLIIGFDVDWQY